MAVKPIIDLAKLSKSQIKALAKQLAPYLKTGAKGGVGTGVGVGIGMGGMDLAKDIAMGGLEKGVDEVQVALDAVQESLGVQIPQSMGQLAGQILKLRINLDDLSKDVGRATGLFTKLGGQLEEISERNRDLGVTFERTSKAMIGLDQGFSLLASSTKKQRQETLRFTFALENLGVAAEDSGKGLEVFARGTAMSQEAARKSTERLIQLSRQISYKGGPAQMMRDIAEIGPMIAKFGTDSERVMGDLAKEARKTGLSMKQIYDVSDQFDTFEGALETAGKLNAQFGLGLSSTALLRADDAQRKQIIVDSFQAQYGSFEGLGDRRQKQFMAEALGLGDNVAAARQYFEGEPLTTTAVDSLEQSAKKQTKVSEMGAATQEKALTAMGDFDLPMGLGRVNEMADQLVTTFSSLNATMSYFNRMTMVEVGADTLGSFFGGRNEIADMIGKFGKAGTQMAILKGAHDIASAERAGIPLQDAGGGGGLHPQGAGGSPLGVGLMGGGAAATGYGAYKYFRRAPGVPTPTAIPRPTSAPGFSRMPGASRVMPGGITRTPSGVLLPPGSSALPRAPGMVPSKVAAEATEQVVKKGAGTVLKTGLKTGAKMGLKALPFIGLGIGLVEATKRISKGDFVGAGLDVTAGAAAMVPFLGTAASVGISGLAVGANMVRDSQKQEAETVRARAQKQSADQATNRQQDSQRQVVASAATTGGASRNLTQHIFLGEDLIWSKTQLLDTDEQLSQTGRRLPKDTGVPITEVIG